MPGTLVRHVIGDVLRSSEAWLEIPGENAVAASVIKSQHHFRIIDRDACTISISGSGTGLSRRHFCIEFQC